MSKTYTYEEAYTSSLQYFHGDELAAKVVVDKYLLRDNEGRFHELNPDDMHWRIAKEFARIEATKFKKPMVAEEIYGYLKDFNQIIPQGGPMYGIGNNFQTVCLSNCFVLQSPLDSYGGILKTDQEIVQISKRRGGVGWDVSNIRPVTLPTNNSSRTTTGIKPFIIRYSNTVREVGQEGRRGASLQSLNVHHPEIETFITLKNDTITATGSNISVKASDEFMNAVIEDKEYEQRWPIDSIPIVSKLVGAREVFNKLCDNAWLRAEPGLLFWDTILRESIPSCYKAFGYLDISTNPCGELVMCADDACRLLLLMLFWFVKHPFTKKAFFDFEEFKKVVYIAQRLMDDLVDLELEKINKIIAKIESDPEPESVKAIELDLWKRIHDKCANARRTGLGQTALADACAALGYGYGTPDSVKFTEEVYKTMKLASYRSSVDMAKEIGPFPIWDHELEKNNPFLLRIKDEDPKLWADAKKYGRRNIANLTTSPAGTASILAGPREYVQTTSSIEPALFLSFTRKKKGNASEANFRTDFTDDNGDTWQLFDILHPKLKMWMDITGETDVSKSPWSGYLAEDISWKNRIDLQAAAQKHVDHSISSTINLPADISKEEVRELYLYAYKAGLKGVTVYRSGSRDGVITQKTQNSNKRPRELPCDIYKISVKGNHYFVVVGLLNDKPYEVFVGQDQDEIKDKHGFVIKQKRKSYQLVNSDRKEILKSITTHSTEDEEAITRMISVSLRHGVDLKYIVHQLEKVDGDMTCFSKSIVRALKKYIPDGTVVTGEDCPNCGNNQLSRESGCVTCKNCGWSKC